jgi:hypothetical protein
VQVQLNDGKGSFTGPLLYPIFSGSGPIAVTAADINGDGRTDVVAANRTNQYVAILYGDGQGGFAAGPTKIAVPRLPNRVTVADLNQDGRADLLATCTGFNDGVMVLLAGTDGSWQGQPLLELPNFASGLVVQDLNGDSLPDLAWYTTSSGGSGINFGTFVGLGDGSFTDGNSRQIFMSLSGLVSGDFDGDHRLDLVINNWTTRQLHVLLNRSY